MGIELLSSRKLWFLGGNMAGTDPEIAGGG